MEAPAYSCPCCGGSWENPPEITFVHGMVYWKGKLVRWRMSGTHTGTLTSNEARVFRILYEHLGQPVSRQTIRQVLFGNRDDGGPSDNSMAVFVSRMKQTLLVEGMPFILHAQRKSPGVYDNSDFTLYRKAPR